MTSRCHSASVASRVNPKKLICPSQSYPINYPTELTVWWMLLHNVQHILDPFFFLSWNCANIVPQSVMKSVQNSWCSFCWDCFYSGHCKFLVRRVDANFEKKSFLSKCLHQGKCFLLFASYMCDRKNYTHHTIIMKRKLLYVVPCPSLNIMLVFQACHLLLSAVSSSFPSYPKPNFRSLTLLNSNPSYLFFLQWHYYLE